MDDDGSALTPRASIFPAKHYAAERTWGRVEAARVSGPETVRTS